MQVQNAVELLKMIGALDEKENLTNLGMFANMLQNAWIISWHILPIL